jgi:multidrug efflux pump
LRFALFFIDRPVFASAISIVTVVVGIISMFSLPISQYPEIAPPTVIVSAGYPGANAKTVAETVATPIEQQINGVEGMLYMSSQSTNDGNMRLTVTFKLGTNLDIAQVQVQNRVTIAQPQLPPEVVRAGIVVKKSSPSITLGMAIYSPDGSRDLLYLSNYTTLQIKDELSRLEGVGDLQLFGVRDYSTRLWLNPNQMASRNITTGDFINSIQEQNVQVAAGIIGGPPLPKGMAQYQYTASAQGRLLRKEEFAEIIIKTGSDGKITRVKDVARVELGAADYSSGTTFNGKPAIGVAVFQLPGSNSIATADNIYRKMNELKRNFPKGVDYSIPYDTTLFVRDSIRDVVVTLFEAILLVAIVVLVFLQSWRAALVPLVAIPVSLVGTFAVMWLFGFSLNNLSLFGLVLSIGIVVDDAIVVVENVDRWIEKGISPRDASYRAMVEVTPAIIAIGFGLTAVFVPVGFISGIQGQFYRQFALTISFATILSAINSLTLSPALAALILRPHSARRDLLTRLINLLFGWFFWLFNRAIGSVNTAYTWILRRVVRFSLLVLAVYCGLLVLTYFLFQAVPFGFIPQQDQGYLITAVVLPDAAAIDRTEEVTNQISEMAKKTKGIQATFSITGFNLFTGTNQTNASTIFLPLESFAKRVGDPAQSADTLVGNLLGQFSQVQEAFTLVLSPPPVQGIGSSSGFKMQIEDRSGLGTPQELAAVTNTLMADARKDPRLTALFSTYRASVPQLWVNVDRTKAKKAKVSITDLFQALQVYLGSFYINDFNFLGRTYKVIVQADAVFRAHAADIAQIKVRNANGDMVPLGTVMDLKDVADADRINRYNLYPSAEINGAGVPGISGNQAIGIMADLAKQDLPVGYSYEWTELAYQEEKAGNTAIYIFPLCILFVFLTHAAEYESFRLSSAIILIVPMCLLCGIAGVYFSELDNNIFTQIGFVVLAGLSVKNAVLIVEFAKQQQEHDPKLRAREAAVEASRLRLRPILMTSFAFIFGVFPLLIASGAGAEMRQALGTVVFYGMLGVTFFGVFLTPVFYSVIRRLGGDKPIRAPGQDTAPMH